MTSTVSRIRGASSRFVALATAALLAVAGSVFALPFAAHADSAVVANATMDWGFKESWRTYMQTNSGLDDVSGGASKTPPYNWGTGNAGSYDTDTKQGSITLPGSVHWHGWHNIDITIAQPKLTFDLDAKTGTITQLVTASGTTTEVTIATVDMGVSTATVTVTANAVTVENAEVKSAQWVPDTFTQYPVGTVLDPVSFSFDYSVPTATTTTLASLPATITHGDSLDIEATVAPVAAGSVEFFDNGTSLGTATVSATGVATVAGVILPVGTSNITAKFTSSDTAYADSTTAAATVVTVNPTPAAATTTTLAAADPAAPVVLGSSVTLTANVEKTSDASVKPAGTIEFFAIAAGTTTQVSLGTATVDAAGAATLTTSTLAAGGHSFVAKFTPADSTAFVASQDSSTGNYGVVDVTQPTVCVPPTATSETLTGVTAAWDWNAYSSGWAKFADGNIAVNGQTFELSDGVATVDASCVRVAFTGTMRVEIYQTFYPAHGQWVELVDPVLTVDSSGDGSWAAGVRSGTADLNTTTSAPMVIATISGSSLDFTTNSVTAQVDLDYANTTAPGTWYVHQDANATPPVPPTPRTDAWSNAFILQTPVAIRSLFYQTSDSPAQANKPPAPVHLSWALAAPTGTVDGLATGAVAEQGQSVTFSAGQFRAGDVVTMVVNSNPVHLPNVTVGANGLAQAIWTVPANFAVGSHTITFTSGARTVSVPFTVRAAKKAAGTTSKSGLANTGAADAPTGLIAAAAGALLLLGGGLTLLRARRRA